MNRPNIVKKTVGTTVIELLPENPKRKAVLILNNSGNILELLSKKSQAYGEGIPIRANDGVYESDHFNCQGAYYAVASGADSDIRIEEDIAEEK